MNLGIMQPYFFPYIGYWQLIANTDQWVFFDNVQYNKRSWMNRNRILHPDKPAEFQYISVPIKKHSRGTLLSEVLINNEMNWKKEIYGKLTGYKKQKANFYDETMDVIDNILSRKYTSLLELSIESTKSICDYLQIDFEYKISSEIDFDKEVIQAPGDWALSICKALGADEYTNPYSGYNIFDENKYRQSGVKIRFLKSYCSPYKQSLNKKFIPGLSIIDVMMFNSKNEIKEILTNDYKIFDKKNLIEELDK